jgi:hypothetical protein
MFQVPNYSAYFKWSILRLSTLHQMSIAPITSKVITFSHLNCHWMRVYIVCSLTFISAKITKKGVNFCYHLEWINTFSLHKHGSRLFLNKYDNLMFILGVTLWRPNCRRCFVLNKLSPSIFFLHLETWVYSNNNIESYF